MSLPITLAIDTAAPRLQLAVLRADGTTDISIDDIATGHAELIFARIASLLARNNLTYPDLARVAVTTGPGSFTGLRIGLSAARGIALAQNIPAIGIPSLLALSLSVSGASTVLLDARRDEAYFQMFFGPGQPISKADIVPMAIAQAAIVPTTTLISSPFVDIALVARYGATADPALYPPEPDYVRDADAKPQSAARIARLTP